MVVVGEEGHSTFAAVPGPSCRSVVDMLLAVESRQLSVESSQPSVACRLLSAA